MLATVKSNPVKIRPNQKDPKSKCCLSCPSSAPACSSLSLKCSHSNLSIISATAVTELGQTHPQLVLRNSTLTILNGLSLLMVSRQNANLTKYKQTKCKTTTKFKSDKMQNQQIANITKCK